MSGDEQKPLSRRRKRQDGVRCTIGVGSIVGACVVCDDERTGRVSRGLQVERVESNDHIAVAFVVGRRTYSLCYRESLVYPTDFQKANIGCRGARRAVSPILSATGSQLPTPPKKRLHEIMMSAPAKARPSFPSSWERQDPETTQDRGNPSYDRVGTSM